MCLVSPPAAWRVQRESIILKWHRRRVHYVIEGLVLGGTDDPSRLCGSNSNVRREGNHSKERGTKSYREMGLVTIN